MDNIGYSYVDTFKCTISTSTVMKYFVNYENNCSKSLYNEAIYFFENYYVYLAGWIQDISCVAVLWYNV